MPGFHGVIFRKTYPEITMPGGLWDTSCEVYNGMGAIPRSGKLDWTFPPYDNTISFHHLQHETNIRQWQGSQVTYFGFDEITHFSEQSVTYIVFSRGRSGCEIPSYTRATCNPDPGWVKTFIAPWVDKEFKGQPARSGEVRYFIRDEGKMLFVPPGTPDAKSLCFVRASVYDNPIMLARNPGYISSLKALLPVDRARLLDGDWDVRRAGLVYPGFEQCVVDRSVGEGEATSIGGIDFGFNNPFAAVWGHIDSDDVLWITGCRYVSQTTLQVHSEALPKGVRYWCDPARPDEIAELRIAGHDAIGCVHRPTLGPGGSKRKPMQSGIDMVSERIRTGRLKILRETCKPLIRELSNYHYDDTKLSEEPVDLDNHACDAMRYLVVGHDRGQSVTSIYPAPSSEEQIARERAERIAAIERKLEAEREAQANIDDERWWQ